MLLYQFLQNKSCSVLYAPIDVRLKGRGNNNKKLPDEKIKTVVQPDVIVVCDQQKLNDDRSVDGAPDLVIEILSPGSSSKDKKEKLLLYEENEVKEYWIADPKNRNITRCVLNNSGKYEDIKTYKEGQRMHSIVLPGLEADISTIFNNISR
jgi:Uma2 family endonuclease